MPQKPEITSITQIAKSRLFTVEAVGLRFSNGVTRIFERLMIRPKSAVMIVPIKDNNLLLIKEYCVGTEKYELYFPKGLVEADETLMQGANRELMEEVGYSAEKITQLKQVSAAPGIINAKMTIMLAEDLSANKQEGDEPEPLQVVTWPINKIDELLMNVDFTEARSLAALFLVKNELIKKGAL